MNTGHEESVQHIKAEKQHIETSQDILHEKRIHYKDKNDLIRLLNIELETFRSMQSEIEAVTHSGVKDLFDKLMYLPSQQEMDEMIDESRRVRAKIEALIQEVEES